MKTLRYLFVLLLVPMLAFAGILTQDGMNNASMIPVANQEINAYYKNSHCNVANNTVEYSTDYPNSGTGGYKFVLGPYTSATDWASDCEFQYRGPTNDAGTARTNFIPGVEYWIGIDLYVPAAGNKWPENDVHPEGGGTEWGLLMQFHGANNPCDISGINPPVPAYMRADAEGLEWDEGYTGFIWRVLGDTRSCLPDRNYERAVSYPMPFSRDTHNHYVMNFIFSADPADGPFMRIWQNNNDVNNPNVDDHGINMYDLPSGVGPYFEFGIYGHITTAFTLYVDDFTVLTPNPGQSRASCFAAVYPGDLGTPTNTPPTISITASGSAASTVQITAGNSLNLQSTTQDDDTGLTVHWYLDGGAADQTVEDPGSVTFSTEGTYNIYAVVTDNDGATGESNHITVIVGTPPIAITGLVHDYRFETGAIEIDTEGNTNLVNDNSTAVDDGADTAYDFYGDYAAVFNGTNQSFHITAANYHASAPWQAGQTDGCVAICYETPSSYPTVNQFLFSLWNQTLNQRILALNLSAGTLSPNGLIGVDAGATAEVFPTSFQLSLNTVYTTFINADSVTGAVRITTFNNSTMVSDYTSTISGTMNLTNRPDMYIGTRSDPTRYFSGKMFWLRLYNEPLTAAQMAEIATDQTPAAPSTVTVDTGGGTPYHEIEGGANDPQCTYTAGNNTSTLTFHCAVSAASGHTSGGIPVTSTANGIQANGGTIGGTGSVVSVQARQSTAAVCGAGCAAGWDCYGGYCTNWQPATGLTYADGGAFDIDVVFSGAGAVDTTLPTNGTIGALNYETPFYIDTTSNTFTAQRVVDSELNPITRNITYRRGDVIYLRLTASDVVRIQDDRSTANIDLPFTLDGGDTLHFKYFAGLGSQYLYLRAVVEANMREGTNLTLSAVGDLDLDFADPGNSITIVDGGDNAFSSTDLVQVSLDELYSVRVDGTPHIRTNRTTANTLNTGR